MGRVELLATVYSALAGGPLLPALIGVVFSIVNAMKIEYLCLVRERKEGKKRVGHWVSKNGRHTCHLSGYLEYGSSIKGILDSLVIHVALSGDCHP